MTANREGFIKLDKLPDNADFFRYQKKVVKNPKDDASHKVTESHIKIYGQDYRVQDKPHPIKSLASRKKDNTDIGRVKRTSK